MIRPHTGATIPRLLPAAIALAPILGCAPSKATGDLGDELKTLGEAEAWAWEEYRVDDLTDDVACSGVDNTSAIIEDVFFAQTHAMAPDWPFFFLIADRPALVEVVVTGEGAAPEVAITAAIDGEVLGTLCMDGPDTLSASVNTTVHKRAGRFTVTLPAEWMQEGLSLEVSTGDEGLESFDAETLGLLHAPELNLMLVMMDVVNYNQSDEGDPYEDIEPPASFLGDLATAMPTTVSRLGRFPVRMVLPTMALGSTEVPEGSPPVVIDQRLCHSEESSSTADCDDSGTVGAWDINAAALRFIDAVQVANGHWASHYYYGNTGQLFPGGWGGGKTFVSADYEWVTIHEMGHAASLPHWGDVFAPEEQDDGWYEYPWGGVGFDGGGRGPSWTYLQHEDRFVSPICEVEWSENFGLERSDAMQRNYSCGEMRGSKEGPWDGFSDFSVYSMFRYMTGAKKNQRGWVEDPVHGEMEYNLPAQTGFPVLEWDEEKPRYVRQERKLGAQYWETYDFWVPQERNTEVFTIYGTYHPADEDATILYEPLYYKGDLPRVLDPTDPETFAELAKGWDGPYGDYFWWSKDLTFKITYQDGTVLHALYPYGSVSREWEYGHGPWRGDLLYFGLNVPADQPITRIQVFERPFLVRYSDWVDEGNVANPDLGITADTFMDDAIEIIDMSL
jgi:hypothetical protein